MNCNKKSKQKKAIAVLAKNKNNVSGIIKFTQLEHNKLEVEYDIKGMKDGKHGFHIHEYGDLSDGCTSACAHFNPFNKTHGGLNSNVRHAGDLGNIISKNKVSKGKLIVNDLSLSYTKTNILGRMIIVHDKEDDLGKGKGDLKEESLKTGNAGSRLACGVIGIASN